MYLLDYISTNLPLPTKIDGSNSPGKLLEETKTLGTIFEVQGDVTKPERAPGDKSARVLILQIVDDGGEKSSFLKINFLF